MTTFSLLRYCTYNLPLIAETVRKNHHILPVLKWFYLQEQNVLLFWKFIWRKFVGNHFWDGIVALLSHQYKMFKTTWIMFFLCVCIGCEYKFLNFLPKRPHLFNTQFLMAKNGHFFTVTILHIKFPLIAETVRKFYRILPALKWFCLQEQNVLLFWKFIWRKFVGNHSSYINFRIICNYYEKANILDTTTLSSISTGQYRWTTSINMSLSTVFGG